MSFNPGVTKQADEITELRSHITSFERVMIAYTEALKIAMTLYGEGSSKGRPLDCLSNDDWKWVVGLQDKATEESARHEREWPKEPEGEK